ncbi:C69 family dipeptidase [Secundilactobacillus malefermentans]|uniref:Dipeptidase n=1 Tax=Secundilactobacillus malefermentans TaxID=176292 RepID=A0A4R5NLZ0_9LACO|nr:C69 family dipeptidase [Secundilactobacillus malefermentans]KRM58457.1 dipeptidase [Secundilactobacillus malefermentans DSM 5705 = KCTC 3548]QEA30764.1 C69 family dipeptidase [Secundilactobacillus malefermentans]TDG75895.1 hypothetical protein C5L31_000671 [Secundilactobacillus malefermentans]
MSKRYTHAACTSFLAGKKATLDQTTLIARNEDNFVAVWPKRAVIHSATELVAPQFVSKGNQFSIELPDTHLAYSATPDTDSSAGPYEESGINSQNVAMSATESAYANERILAFDPLVDNGIAEDAMLTVVLPYISTAREGINRLGKIVTTSGAAEVNGVLFSDQQEVWYMEIVSGHHFVAQRIPDDSYAVVANQLAIQEIDFNNSTDFIVSDGIQEFVKKNKLNPDDSGFNSRHIFGTRDVSDQHYNTPRVWYGQKLFTPNVDQEPTSLELPFIRKANHKISVEDVERLLSSHYEETKFDPLGNGTDAEKTRFRAISLSRTQNSHILQIRNEKQSELNGLIWQGFATSAYTPYVPFFANATKFGSQYQTIDLKNVNLENAYWLYRSISTLVDTNPTHFSSAIQKYKKQVQQYGLARIQAANDLKDFTPDNLGRFNQKTSDETLKLANNFFSELLLSSAEFSKLTFTMDQSL